ncbi:hypothetical protein HHI36_008312 [Cryptolaemus montrouzieri]|uniref:Uncharacterized protein n=1 Tax=Cryptolaemus montrouzieri TaxID=559131 RepID=A0ABD2MT08_9CUCU
MKLSAFILLSLFCQAYSRWASNEQLNKYSISDSDKKSEEILVEPLTADAQRKLEENLFNEKLIERIKKIWKVPLLLTQRRSRRNQLKDIAWVLYLCLFACKL